MIPIGRSIPIPPASAVPDPHPSPCADPFSSNSFGSSLPSSYDSAFFSRRRRSSIDTILANLKFVGAFPQRVMNDLVSPVNPTHGGETHGGLRSFGSTAADLGASSHSLLTPPTMSAQSSASDLKSANPGVAQAAALREILIQNQKPIKMPTAEAFLSI